MNRAFAYEFLGQYDNAIADYTKLMELERSDVKLAIECRAELYFKKSDYEKAWEDVRKAESLGVARDPEFLSKLKKASGQK
ncbi:MAG: hypothetical protein HY706_15285 [Candidatus Hydrogenedentes bacterium]|nr:hypothetical protein [Candidatus Hydrogenedentota bacterium]